ncbi:hypothetical protein HW555_012788, partial [Spodoptera exigua]
MFLMVRRSNQFGNIVVFDTGPKLGKPVSWARVSTEDLSFNNLVHTVISLSCYGFRKYLSMS